jgi:hypothetical protein
MSKPFIGKKPFIILGIGIIAVVTFTLLFQNKQTAHLSLPNLPVAIPKYVPEDVELSKAEEVPHDFSPYHRYTYTGAGREIIVVEQLGGWNYNPHEKCMYMVATKDKSGETAIDPDITCTSIDTVNTDNHKQAEVFKVNVTGPVDNPNAIPNYYIAYSVNRFAIKAIKGSITDQEAKAMAIAFDSHNFKDLQSSVAH